MCGIAGYSLKSDAVKPKWLLHRLLVGVSARGTDSVGAATIDPLNGDIVVQKWQGLVKDMLAGLFEDEERVAFVHVREYTKGSPLIPENNHPIKHGDVVGIHNGVIQNDDELFVEMEVAREQPLMTVDSEAIFMLVDNGVVKPWEKLVGTYSAAWLREQDDSLCLLKGSGRPLYLLESDIGILFASTKETLEDVATACGLNGVVRRVPVGTFLRIRNGIITAREHFAPRLPENYEVPNYEDYAHLKEQAEQVLHNLISSQ